MNIGSLLRGMMGDTKAGETKQLDLKEGQVVRGVVLSVSEDGQEAVLQIQGVKVRAALETPLQPGQAAVLQVQPDNGGGLPVLKAMEGSPMGPGLRCRLRMCCNRSICRIRRRIGPCWRRCGLRAYM